MRHRHSNDRPQGRARGNARVSGVLYVGRGKRRRLYLRDDAGREYPVGPRLSVPAFPGDRVKAELVKPDWAHYRRGRRGSMESPIEASIVEVVSRGRGTIIGKYHTTKSRAWISPRDAGAVAPLEVEVRSDVAEGAMVAVEVGRHPGIFSGKIVQSWGDPDAGRAQLEQVIYERELPREFPPAVLAEAEAFPGEVPREEISRRRDLRGLEVVVIDPADAKDHDDAVSWEPRPGGGGRLGVHIADVSWFVRPGTALDAEAITRGVSVYLPDRVLPMLPPRLSGDLCSLLEGKDRMARTVFLDIDAAGRVTGGEECASVIRPSSGMSYGEAWECIEGRDRKHPRAGVLVAMDALAGRMRKRRFDNGSLDFDLPETKVVLDKRGEPTGVELKRTNRSNWLVEEFMIAANEFTGRMLARAGTGIWRIHEPPDMDDVMELEEFLSGFGVKLRRGSRSMDLDPRDFNAVLARFKGTPEEYVVHRKVLQSLKLAVYSEKNSGHFGLGLECYTHFTSPIRRYADLVVHRLLSARPGTPPPYHTRRLAEMAKEISMLERRAEDAERECVRLLILRHLSRRLGDAFDGTISRLEKFGAFVELDGMGMDGLLRHGDLAPDRFQVARDGLSMRARHSRTTVKVGQRVRVVLSRVDIPNRQVDLVLAED